MRQYLDIKAENPDAILFFRMGDFYEMFFEDARVASKALSITLTSRDKEKEIPMCGVPYHAAASYIARLVKDGYSVAVCEQIEDPASATGVVKRAVARVITPGIVLEDELLDPRTNNFIAACLAGKTSCGFAYMDVSTGEFRLTEVGSGAALADEIKRIQPIELLVPEGFSADITREDYQIKKLTVVSSALFDYQRSLARLNGHFGTNSLDGFGCDGMTEAIRSAGALLEYIKTTQRSELSHVIRCAPYYPDDYLVLDPSTRKNLEVLAGAQTGSKAGSLLNVLDRTKTSMGARRLRSWLIHPLKDIIRIRTRQDAISELLENRHLRQQVQELLDQIYDLERLTVKISIGTAGPRDLVALKNTLKVVPEIKRILGLFNSGLIASLWAMTDECEEAATLIDRSIMETPSHNVRDGGVIRQGYSAELDELRDTSAGGKDKLAAIEAFERARTGINSLRIGYNRVFGYYLEITKSNISNVPAEYTRKQTLTNAERYITPELKDWEEKILTAHDRSLGLEAALFAKVVKELCVYAGRMRQSAESIATLDAICSLSDAAGEFGYVRPDINDGSAIAIEAGRHPVIEASVKDGFVSNDLRLDSTQDQIVILTGPNMAGKSTYLRQNALIVLMAQIGSFVPAVSASIGIVDRIFSRVGASDDISRGQSTFMVEMNETANILNNATSSSFIILDEIGRGTSTFDGLSIAWAVVEYLHDNPEIRAKTIFATHYHELTELSLTKERVKNYNMAVKEWNDKIIFLRKVLPGGSSRSYGIQVARLAGLPQPLIERAREVLSNLESTELDNSGEPRLAAGGSAHTAPLQMSLLGGKDPLREALRAIDINTMTPIEALTRLQQIKESLET